MCIWPSKSLFTTLETNRYLYRHNKRYVLACKCIHTISAYHAIEDCISKIRTGDLSFVYDNLLVPFLPYWCLLYLQAFYKSRLMKLRVAPSETAMTDVLREVCIVAKSWRIICDPDPCYLSCNISYKL